MPALLYFVASQPRQAQRAATPLALWLLLAGLGIAGSIFVAVGKLRPDLPTQRFVALALIALSLSEFCSIIGFLNQLMGGGSMLPFAGATWAVTLLLIAPRVLSFRGSKMGGGGSIH